MPKTGKDIQKKFWTGTWNNPPGSDDDDWATNCRWPMPLHEAVAGLIYSLEIAESGTKHFQWTIKFHTQQRLSAIKKMYPHVHAEPCISVTASVGYCQKDDETHVAGPFKHGETVAEERGRRTDLDDVRAAIKNGVGDYELYDKYFGTMARFPQLANKARMAFATKELRKLTVEVYYGTSGSGKSYKAYSENPDAFRKPDKGEWWDGYQMEQTVIIDDFNGNLAFQDMLKILDVYPHRVQVKGGYVPANWTKIIITSNFHPKQWYYKYFESHPEHWAALKRRLTKVLLFSEPYADGTVPAYTDISKEIEDYAPLQAFQAETS